MILIYPNVTLKVLVDQELRLYNNEAIGIGNLEKKKREDLSVSLNCGVLNEIADLRMTIGVLWSVERGLSQPQCSEMVGRWLNGC